MVRIIRHHSGDGRQVRNQYEVLTYRFVMSRAFVSGWRSARSGVVADVSRCSQIKMAKPAGRGGGFRHRRWRSYCSARRARVRRWGKCQRRDVADGNLSSAGINTTGREDPAAVAGGRLGAKHQQHCRPPAVGVADQPMAGYTQQYRRRSLFRSANSFVAEMSAARPDAGAPGKCLSRSRFAFDSTGDALFMVSAARSTVNHSAMGSRRSGAEFGFSSFSVI